MYQEFHHSRFIKHVNWIMIPIMLFYSIGCQYYRAKIRTADSLTEIEDIGTIGKTFVVHSGTDMWVIENISVDSLAISGKLTAPVKPILYHEESGSQLNKNNEDIINEVHIYLKQPLSDPNTDRIPLADIDEIRIIDMATGKTIAAFFFGLVTITVSAFAIILIVAISLKSSCPYVYVYDGETFVFIGETFGGAIGENLHRHDYVPLPAIQPDHGQYRLRISNELKEKQYTDVANLIVVEHGVDQQILIDDQGKLHDVSNQQMPMIAKDYAGADILPRIAQKDRERFYFDDASHSTNGAILTFNRPENVSEAKLVLNAKNTLYFDYLFGKFLEKFGTSFNTWMEQQEQLPQEERQQKIIDLQFPLSVYVKKEHEWVLIDHINTVGPLADRNLCIPLDLQGIDDKKVEVKIETGFMFWELDYAAIDFTSDSAFTFQELPPTKAFGTGGQNWTTALSNLDNQMMAQENTGEITEVVYTIPPVTDGKIQSCFLHSYGYYKLVREFEGKPQMTELLTFRQPGHFSDYSREYYLMLLNRKESLTESISNEKH